MSTRRLFRLAFVSSAIVLLATSARADWLADGTPLVQEINNQDIRSVVPDGWGGVIVVWQDKRTGPLADVYAQRVNADGDRMWLPATGVPVCTDPGQQLNCSAASDGAGGVIVTWEDYRAGGDVYAQRIDALGRAMWTTNGVPVCTAANLQDIPRAVPFGVNGAVIAWFDRRSGDFDIYAQRLDGDGNSLWVPNGVPVCTAADDQTWPEIVADQSGGVFIVWEDSRTGVSSDIYAQRLTAAGVPSWASNGVAICVDTLGQFLPQIVADGAGGAIVAWEDNRSGESDVYAQRIDALGAPLWTDDGEIVCGAADSQLDALLVADGAGGGIIAWTDYRDPSNAPDVYAQRISGAGALQWTADGVAVCAAADGQYLTGIVADGALGAFFAWSDSRSGSSDIYAQRLNGAGAAQWTPDGEALCTADGYQFDPLVATDGNGCAIVAWTDPRAGDNDICVLNTPGCSTTGVADDAPPACRARLHQNAPNPFRRSTRIEYELDASSDVVLEVFDVRGRRVHVERQSGQTPGLHTIDYSGLTDRGESLPAGVYYYRLTAAGTRLTKRMTVIR